MFFSLLSSSSLFLPLPMYYTYLQIVVVDSVVSAVAVVAVAVVAAVVILVSSCLFSYLQICCSFA